MALGPRAQKVRGDEPPVPIEAAYHQYFNGSESAYLRFYGDSEKWKGNAELPVSTPAVTPTPLSVQTSTDFKEETSQRCGLHVSRLWEDLQLGSAVEGADRRAIDVRCCVINGLFCTEV